MKKVNFKAVFAAFIFALSFLAVGLTDGNAQHSTAVAGLAAAGLPGNGQGVFATPTGPFVNNLTASNRLKAEMLAIKDQMSKGAFTPGTQPATFATNKLTYYKAIYGELEGGESVDRAIVKSLTVLAPEFVMADLAFLTDYKNAAIALLR